MNKINIISKIVKLKLIIVIAFFLLVVPAYAEEVQDNDISNKENNLSQDYLYYYSENMNACFLESVKQNDLDTVNRKRNQNDDLQQNGSGAFDTQINEIKNEIATNDFEHSILDYSEENNEGVDELSINNNINDSDADTLELIGWTETELGKQYLDNNGIPLTGTQIIDGYLYYFDDNGVLQTGWICLNENQYYANPEGVLYSNQIISFGSTYYYMGSDGSVQKGIVKTSSGKLYYADETTGIIQRQAGWIEKEGKRYFCNSEGILYSNQIISFGSTYYYMGSDGSVQKGIVKTSSGSIFYADENTGIIKTTQGWVETNGKRYYVMQGGNLYKNQFIHSIDSNGSKKYYYMGSDCSVTVGTFTINGVTYTTDENGVINEEVVLQGTKGIDVSVFQGVIDWQKVKAAGITFAFIRVGGRYYGSGGMYDDSNFVTNIKGAIAAGIKVGVYFFTQAINNSEALEEAIYTINKIRGYNISMPVVIDTESTPNGRHNKISVATRTSVIKTFCDRIQAAGYTPMIYASTSWLNNQLNMSALSNYLVWVAQYYYKVTYNGAYSCWQYTSSGKVNGISGNVDMDYWYGSADSLITE